MTPYTKIIHNKLSIVITFGWREKEGNRIQWEAFTIYEMFYFFKIIRSKVTMAKC